MIWNMDDPRGQNYNENHTLPWENNTQNYWSQVVVSGSLDS